MRGMERADWRIILDCLEHRPSMLLSRIEFFAAVDFLNGYDLCCGRLGLREGFHDWLVVRLDSEESGAAWPWLALMLIPGYDPQDRGRVFPGREQELINSLVDLLSEYLSENHEVGPSPLCCA